MTALPLRDYQRAALDAIHERRANGQSRLLLALPTGSGKTLVATHAMRELGYERAVMMVHRDELVRQSVEAIKNSDPDVDVGVVKAERDDLDAQVIVASAQTLAREARLDRLRDAVGAGQLFVSDEAHHDAAPTRTRAIERMEPGFLLGLTATPKRGDNVALDHIYEDIAYTVPILELIAREILAPLRGMHIDTRVDLDGVHTVAGEFNQGELERTVNVADRNGLIVQTWFTHASDRRRTVAFCASRAHAQSLRDAFRVSGVDAEMIDATTPGDERQDILRRFALGKLPILTNVMVLTEGYDEPGIDCVLMCRPTKSQSLYVQMVGRAARRGQHVGKLDALIIDFVDATRKHKLITFPTLAGRDPAGGAKAASSSVLAPLPEGQQYDLLDLAREMDSVATTINLFAASAYLWKQVSYMGQPVWMAPAGRNTNGDERSLFLREVVKGESYVPCALVFDGKEKRQRIHPLFDRAVNIETAMSLAESKVNLDALTDKTAYWRTVDKEPTEGQLRMARALGVRVPSGATRAQLSGLLDEAAFMAAYRRALLEETHV